MSPLIIIQLCHFWLTCHTLTDKSLISLILDLTDYISAQKICWQFTSVAIDKFKVIFQHWWAACNPPCCSGGIWKPRPCFPCCCLCFDYFHFVGKSISSFEGLFLYWALLWLIKNIVWWSSSTAIWPVVHVGKAGDPIFSKVSTFFDHFKFHGRLDGFCDYPRLFSHQG